ncbi:hypothetical protein BDW72DRAFT_183827 [Aspergillus terricola var. indicus]
MTFIFIHHHDMRKKKGKQEKVEEILRHPPQGLESAQRQPAPPLKKPQTVSTVARTHASQVSSQSAIQRYQGTTSQQASRTSDLGQIEYQAASERQQHVRKMRDEGQKERPYATCRFES